MRDGEGEDKVLEIIHISLSLRQINGSSFSCFLAEYYLSDTYFTLCIDSALGCVCVCFFLTVGKLTLSIPIEKMI